jgi:recombination protein RecR
MSFSPLLKQLIHAFTVLPGVGSKSAQRMAFYLLERDRNAGTHLGKIIEQAMIEVGFCQRCRILCETDLCQLCSSGTRDASILCLVQTPQDVIAIENAGSYRGYYFVLSGSLSPIDGIGPEQIGIESLQERLEDPALKEAIIATHATVEGEATAYYLADMLKKRGLKVSRIAFGVPMGGELEYVDSNTLAKALISRTEMA